ncbi:MAG: hypothetical protein RL032_1188 [Pseudomonadota bacterium]|jgi:hypothetical protein
MKDSTAFSQDDNYAKTQISEFQAGSMASGPSVLSLTLRDLQAAAVDGVITNMQASQLWAHLGGSTMAHAAGPTPAPRFGFVNVLYYFGGLVAISAMGLFMTLGFESMGAVGLLAIGLAYMVACLKVADHFKSRTLPVPAGILATLAVVLVPLVVWSAQSLMGLWPPGGSGTFRSYYTIINWRWMTLEFATLAAGVVMLWRYRLPFMVMPVAVTVWYMSMDIANALMKSNGFDWQFSRDVSVVFGIATVALALWVDVRTRLSKNTEWQQDFAFWLHLFGATMFWCGLSLQDSNNELGKFLYALLNVALVLAGAAIGRRVFTVYGALGVAMYLGHLSYQVFRSSMMFSFALTLIGLGTVWLGVLWQRHEDAINSRLARYVPARLRPVTQPAY